MREVACQLSWNLFQPPQRSKRFPAAEVLQHEEVPIPEPGPNEFLIKVEAAALDRADLALRKGAYRIDPEELPDIPGREFAETVAKLGAGIQQFKVGQRVVACTGTSWHPAFRVSFSECGPALPDREATGKCTAEFAAGKEYSSFLAVGDGKLLW